MGKNKIPMPTTFRAHALEPSGMLAAKYNVSKQTVSNWRKTIGVAAPCGHPRGTPAPNAGVRRVSSGGRYMDKDIAEVCLSCPAPHCRGDCDRIRMRVVKND